MPDFEALIRHQQKQKPSSSERLKVVEDPTSGTLSTNEPNKKATSVAILAFFGGLLGSALATITIQYAPLIRTSLNFDSLIAILK